MPFYFIDLNTQQISAFGGDISCDFESDNWDEGFCNWKYDFASTDVFVRTNGTFSDLTLKKRWNFGKQT
jgi:hypothetical protein